MSPISLPCKRCSNPVELEPDLARFANDHGVFCADCMDALQKQERQGDHAKLSRGAYARLCPPCFLDTDPDRLPCPGKSDEALLWRYGAQGLNLWGVPGTGKSRTMSLIIQREVAHKRTVIAMGPGMFRSGCEKFAWRRANWLKMLSRVDLLFLDDLGHANLTREMERDLFSVLDARAGRRPTLYTGNSNSADLANLFKMGEALVRRIKDFCYHVHFGQPGSGA